MKIGIDCRMYRSGVAGIGRYSQNLVKNLLEIDHDDEFVFFMTSEDIKEFKESHPEFISGSHSKLAKPLGLTRGGQVQHDKFKIVETNIPHFGLAEQTKLGKIIENEKLDLMHFLNFNHPINYKGKFIVTIHDLTLLLFPDTAKRTNLVKKIAFRHVIKQACQNAENIIAVSKSTKNDIINTFRINPEKIKVIYEAADDREFRIKNQASSIKELKEKYHLNELPVILYVGQMRPHKNLPSLIEAFDLLRKDVNARLVIVGKADPRHHRFFHALDNSPNKRDIIMPGFVSNEELYAWYKIAAVFCFPSLYEGFGLPGLEAMQAGTAVISSNTSSLPEIYQNAALYFDPLKIESIADKIKEVIINSKLRADLIARGKIQAAKYNWQKTVEETLKIYKENF